MAGHSHAKNVKRRKDSQNAKKSLSFSKLSHAVFIAALNGSDPETNYSLKIAIKKASQGSLPKDRIDSAIKRASGEDGGVAMSQVRYNGTIGKAIFIIEALTDNKNRTASNVKHAFTKSGGSISDSNSLEFMFSNIGIIEFAKSDNPEYSLSEIEDIALENEAENVIENDDSYIIETKTSDLHKIASKLPEKYSNPSNVKLIWKPSNIIEVDEDSMIKINKALDKLEEDDDVSEIYYNFNL